MVFSDHSSTCEGPNGTFITGGLSCGFIINIPNHLITLYHTSDTNLFTDMKLICDLYKPTIVLLPIGNVDSMGPREAAYACQNLLPTAKIIIPMHFNYEDGPTDMFEKFVKYWTQMNVVGKDYNHPKDYFGGKSIKR